MTILGFQPGTIGPRGLSQAPEPGRGGAGPIAGPVAEREWGLSAKQVVAAVLAIVVACEVIGLLF